MGIPEISFFRGLSLAGWHSEFSGVRGRPSAHECGPKHLHGSGSNVIVAAISGLVFLPRQLQDLPFRGSECRVVRQVSLAFLLSFDLTQGKRRAEISLAREGLTHRLPQSPV